MQQVEQHLGGITVAPDGLAGLLEVDSSTAEDGEPQDRHGGRDEQDHHDELANRAAAGNTGQEHTHERGPGDPPCPVEDGPGRQPVTGVLGGLGGAGGHGEEVLQVVTQGRRDHVHDDDGRADNKDEQGDDRGQHHVRIRDPLNTLAHAGCGGEQEGDAEHDNDADDQGVAGVIDPVDDLHARGNLAGTDTQGGSGTEDGGEDGQDVDELTEPALGEAVADQRDERGAQQLLAPQAEGAVGDGQADDGVQRPRVEAPVEERRREGLAHVALRAPRHAVAEEGQRLSGSVEHQADAHTGGEHHRDPGEC